MAESKEFEENITPSNTRRQWRRRAVDGVPSQPGEFVQHIAVISDAVTHADACCWYGPTWMNSPLYKADDPENELENQPEAASENAQRRSAELAALEELLLPGDPALLPGAPTDKTA